MAPASAASADRNSGRTWRSSRLASRLALWLPLTSVLASSGIAGKVTIITHAASPAGAVQQHRSLVFLQPKHLERDRVMPRQSESAALIARNGEILRDLESFADA